MADIEELRQMIYSFRVSELQVLLGFAGQNKSGRKQELMTRSLSLVHRGCSTPIQIKVRELYRRRFPSKSAGSSVEADIKTPPRLGSLLNSPPLASPLQRATEIGNSLGGLLEAPVDFSMKQRSPSHSSLPIHPDVSFKPLPFYDVLGDLLKPTSLVPRGSSRFQETYFVFHLTPQQAQDIAMSRDIRPGARVEYTVQILLRFCLLETSCEQSDNFPPSVCVRVNGKMAPLPNPIPTNKPGVEPKRPNRPVNITSICRICPTAPNHINVSWAAEFGRGYCIGVWLINKLSSDTLMQRLKARGIRHPDHSRAMIKEKLRHDPDSEIATTSLKVSLMCPLGKMRMTVPARAATCTHLQCFDVQTYLMMNEKKPTWICPVCDKPAEYNQLNLDGYYIEILKQCSSTEIQFLEDGSWCPLEESETKKGAQVIDSPRVANKCFTSQPIVEAITVKEEKTEQAEVIDLTLSSSEDEDDDSDTEDMTEKTMLMSPSSSQAMSPCSTWANTTESSSSSSMNISDAPNASRLIELEDQIGRWPPRSSSIFASNLRASMATEASRASCIPRLTSMPPLPGLFVPPTLSVPDMPDIFNMDFSMDRIDRDFREFLERPSSTHTNNHSIPSNTFNFGGHASTNSERLPSFTYSIEQVHDNEDSSGSDIIPLD